MYSDSGGFQEVNGNAYENEGFYGLLPVRVNSSYQPPVVPSDLNPINHSNAIDSFGLASLPDQLFDKNVDNFHSFRDESLCIGVSSYDETLDNFKSIKEDSHIQGYSFSKDGIKPTHELKAARKPPRSGNNNRSKGSSNQSQKLKGNPASSAVNTRLLEDLRSQKIKDFDLKV